MKFGRPEVEVPGEEEVEEEGEEGEEEEEGVEVVVEERAEEA